MTERWLHSLLMPLAILVLLLLNPASVIGSYYIQQEESGNVLFPPYIYMQYGPAPDAAIPLYQISAQVGVSNQTTTIFNPLTNIDSLEYAVNITLMPITSASNLQPSFDSFFTTNKLLKQSIPQVSNVSVELAPVLNPLEVQEGQIVQIDTGPFVPLMMNEQEQDYMPSFSIPPYLADGFYFVQLSAFFPDQAVNAVFANTLCLGDCLSAVLTSLNATEREDLNMQFNNDTKLDNLYGSK